MSSTYQHAAVLFRRKPLSQNNVTDILNLAITDLFHMLSADLLHCSPLHSNRPRNEKTSYMGSKKLHSMPDLPLRAALTSIAIPATGTRTAIGAAPAIRCQHTRTATGAPSAVRRQLALPLLLEQPVVQTVEMSQQVLLHPPVTGQRQIGQQIFHRLQQTLDKLRNVRTALALVHNRVGRITEHPGRDHRSRGQGDGLQSNLELFRKDGPLCVQRIADVRNVVYNLAE